MRCIFDKLSAFYDKRGAVCFGVAAFSCLLFSSPERPSGCQITETFGNATLLCADAVAGAPYSANASNAWEESSLRQWLNTPFLSAFSDSERAGQLLTETPVLLTRDTKGTASSGSRDIYFSLVPLLASRGYEEAYQTVLWDTVTLPDIDLITRLTVEKSSRYLYRPIRSAKTAKPLHWAVSLFSYVPIGAKNSEED